MFEIFKFKVSIKNSKVIYVDIYFDLLNYIKTNT